MSFDLAPPISLEAFIAAEEVSQRRAELVDGRVVPMPPTTLRHGVIVGNLAMRIGSVVRARGGMVLSSGTYVRNERNAFLPDVLAWTGNADLQRIGEVDLVLNPAVLAEVLSPETSDFDQGTRWENYRRIASLREYLLVAQDEPRVEQYTRQRDASWRSLK